MDYWKKVQLFLIIAGALLLGSVNTKKQDAEAFCGIVRHDESREIMVQCFNEYNNTWVGRRIWSCASDTMELGDFLFDLCGDNEALRQFGSCIGKGYDYKKQLTAKEDEELMRVNECVQVAADVSLNKN